MKDYHSRSSEGFGGNDPSLGRRLSGGDGNWKSKAVLLQGLRNEQLGKTGSFKGAFVGKRNALFSKHVKSIAKMLAFVGLLFMLDSFLVSVSDSLRHESVSTLLKSDDVDRGAYSEEAKPVPVQMYGRLLSMASSALADKEFEQETRFWSELHVKAREWKPCADRKISNKPGRVGRSNGYIMVSANGGLNQQRVAICNAVAVASLLNATLVLPTFLYSNVWKDPSQFGDIYQEKYFFDMMKDEVDIVKELPGRFKSLNIEAIGSLITDSDLPKEATPNDYHEKVLPILLRNGVVHLLGFGNRLGFDPLPSEIQRLRCKCNFHALKFVPKIQEAGSLLIQRIRRYEATPTTLDKQLLGEYASNTPSIPQDETKRPLKYLAVHLRFEIDMIAYSLCYFGGGPVEKQELQAYRESHFPLLIERLRKSKPISTEALRKTGKCPLTPEEAGLVLAGLGFKRGTHIYLAGSQVYGGSSRMQPFVSLFPNLITKETLLTPAELAPFRNFSSQMAALDLIACASADVFAMTDSGSQLASLVSGLRTYYGGGKAPTLRPNKKRLAAILYENNSIPWNGFEERVRRMIEESQRARTRRFGRSIYRQPRCPECMCSSSSSNSNSQ
ncbi:O-fucosyltransferase 8 [Linum perenne]